LPPPHGALNAIVSGVSVSSLSISDAIASA
jgi:hypothetical protein